MASDQRGGAVVTGAASGIGRAIAARLAAALHGFGVGAGDRVAIVLRNDIPFLEAWGQPLLFGPGSVHVAHTAEEFISIAELHAAVDHYVSIAKLLLASS